MSEMVLRDLIDWHVGSDACLDAGNGAVGWNAVPYKRLPGVNGDRHSERRMANFDSCRIETLEPINIKFSTGDYVRKTTPCTKFGVNPFTAGFCANRWNITLLTFYWYIPFFVNSPTGQTLQQIFTRDGSKDVVSRKDVPFGVKIIKINV